MTTQVASQGPAHQMLADGPGHSGKGQGEQQGSSQHGFVSITFVVTQRIPKKIGAEGGKDHTEKQAEIFFSLHLGDRLALRALA